MKDNMILFAYDECGDEVEVERYTIGLDLDEAYTELWKCMMIDEAKEKYPEARGFHFEDRRDWSHIINMMARNDEYYDPWEDEEVPL